MSAMTEPRPANWLEAKRREQAPQALARLAVIVLFMSLCGFMWALRVPMPLPFFLVLCVEALFFLAYWRVMIVIPTARGIEVGHYAMLAAEIVFHTTMVYFLGGISWLGGFAYVFGLIFANAFLDPKRGFIYTMGVVSAFVSLALLEAGGAIPHYAYLNDGTAYRDGRTVFTTVVAGAGVFISIYAWVNWVGRQLRHERDIAMRSQLQLLKAQAAMTSANEALEARVEGRTQELSQTNSALQESEAMLRATIESTTDGILVVDKEGKAAYTNARFAEMWRIPAAILATRDDDQLIGFVLDQLVDPEAFLSTVRELYQTEREDFDTLLFKDGRIFERYSRPLVTAAGVSGRVWSFRDITTRRRAEETLRKQASRDPLTNCLNHAAIAAEIAAMTDRDGARVALVMADVDGMKAINDTYGHQIGDAALMAVARALSRVGAVVGRYGGDEFIAALVAVSRAEAEQYCQDALQQLQAAVVMDAATGSRIPVIASLGLAMFPDDAPNIDDAIRLADDAMYAEKRERKLAGDSAQSRGVLPDERAAKMIGEIVPLLTSPGDLDDKLRLVAQRLSAGAGYEVVRFRIGGRSDEPGRHPIHASSDCEIVNEWERERSARSRGPFREVLERTRRPIIIHDIQDDLHRSAAELDLIRAAGIRGVAIVPMVWQDELIGTLSVGAQRAGSIDARDVQFLATIADQVTAIIHMEALVTDLQAATSQLNDARADTVILLAAAAEAHEKTTGAHLLRVQLLCERLARELGHDEESALAIGQAALLHDIGKIRVPERILLSPARLDGSEWTIMKQHTTWGAEFLAQRPGFEMAATIAACHHERWDGEGYPQGLSGAQIPEAATIVTVADSFDAITSERPYRSARTAEWAIEEIVRCSGAQFSPRVVDALRRLYARGDLRVAGGGAEQAAA
jgi:diguanylate cyclase (GGDEF)-like protein/putative nucleotidyltransferase with HDIG domain/PAS domain S-box-containing protein